MPLTSRALRILLAAACALLAASCAPAEQPEPRESLPTTHAPVFATEDDALAAASASYQRYQWAIDSALSNYDPTVLDAVASGEALTSSQEAVTRLSTSGKHVVGQTEVYNVRFADSAGLSSVDGLVGSASIYACIDVSAVDMLDAAGNSTIVGTSGPTYPFVATLRWVGPPQDFVVTSNDFWSGEDFCDRSE